MSAPLLNWFLAQTLLHLMSYALVTCVLIAAGADALLLRRVRRVLLKESAHLRSDDLDLAALPGMLHPLASVAATLGTSLDQPSETALQRQVDLAEARFFVPLRARMALVRDLSTLMGLIATLLALVAAATEFARHGQPERLIGSVGTGCIATCIAAAGCAVALWNLARLTQLRVVVAADMEQVLKASTVHAPSYSK